MLYCKSYIALYESMIFSTAKHDDMCFFQNEIEKSEAKGGKAEVG